MTSEELQEYKLKFMKEELNRQEIATLIVAFEEALAELEAQRRDTAYMTPIGFKLP